MSGLACSCLISVKKPYSCKHNIILAAKVVEISVIICQTLLCLALNFVCN